MQQQSPAALENVYRDRFKFLESSSKRQNETNNTLGYSNSKSTEKKERFSAFKTKNFAYKRTPEKLNFIQQPSEELRQTPVENLNELQAEQPLERKRTIEVPEKDDEVIQGDLKTGTFRTSDVYKNMKQEFTFVAYSNEKTDTGPMMNFTELEEAEPNTQRLEHLQNSSGLKLDMHTIQFTRRKDENGVARCSPSPNLLISPSDRSSTVVDPMNMTNSNAQHLRREVSKFNTNVPEPATFKFLKQPIIHGHKRSLSSAAPNGSGVTDIQLGQGSFISNSGLSGSTLTPNNQISKIQLQEKVKCL